MTKTVRSELLACPAQGLRGLAAKASKAVTALKEVATALELLDCDLYHDPAQADEEASDDRPLLVAHLAQCEWLSGLSELQAAVASAQAEKAYLQNHARLLGALTDLQEWANDLPAPTEEGLAAYPQLGSVVAHLEEVVASVPVVVR